MTRRTVHDMVNEAKAEIEELTVKQVAAEIEAGTAVVIDIRDIRERVDKGAIPGAISAPRGMLEFWFDPESPYYNERYKFDDRYVFHCAAGWRSALATKAVQDMGLARVCHIGDGYRGWKDSGAATEDVERR